MSGTSHTPAPWVLKGEVRRVGDTYHYCADIYDGRPSEGYRGTVAIIQTSDHLTHGMRIDEGKANAKLIAAAPTMADAIMGLIGLCQMLRNRDDCPTEIRQALTHNHRLIAGYEALSAAGIEGFQPTDFDAHKAGEAA